MSTAQFRTAWAIPLLLLPLACASGGDTAHMPIPDWSGPPVNVRHQGDGSLQVELMAPTAGHRFSLHDITRDGFRADLHLRHELPTADFVAQVITPLTVTIPAARLGDASAICVWITGSDQVSTLAVATARPR